MKIYKLLPLALLFVGCSNVKFTSTNTPIAPTEPLAPQFTDQPSEIITYNYLMGISETDSQFTHIATITPHLINGKALQATGITSKGSTVFVVYNTEGEEVRGGLDVLSVSDVATPKFLSSVVSQDREYAEVKEKDGYVFMVGQKKGVTTHNVAVLTVMNVTNSAEPIAAGEITFDQGYYATSIDIEGTLAYIAVPNLGVKVVDISNPAFPVEVKTETSLPLFARRLQNKTLALGGENALKLTSLTPLPPVDLHTLDSVRHEAPSRFTLNENTLYSNAAGKLTILDLVSFTSPALRSETPLQGRGNGIAEQACMAYLAQGEKGLSVYDVKDKSTPGSRGSFDYADDAGSANNTYVMTTNRQKMVFVSDGRAGIKIVKVDGDVAGCEEKGGPGLLCKVYNLPTTTKSVPDFSTMTPVGQFVTDKLDVTNRTSDNSFPYFPTALKTMKEWYGISCEGDLVAEETGTYTTDLTSDDGSNLYMDGALHISNDMQHSYKTITKTQARVKGQSYHFKVDYFQGPKTSIALELKEKSPTGTLQYLKGFSH